MIVVNITSKTLVLKLKFEEANTLGIIKKIIKGFVTPPVRKSKIPNCKISIIKKKNADPSDNWVLLLNKIKYKLLNIPKNITKFEVIKSKSKPKKKYTKLTDINWPIIPIHLKEI